MKKIFIVSGFIIVLLVSFLGITYSYEYVDSNSLNFELIGPSLLYVDVNSEYHEYGIKVVDNGVDISYLVNIDSSSVDMNTLGEYKVRYELVVDGNLEYVYRVVKVIDQTGPEIKLKGNNEVTVLLGSGYIEEGYEVYDNYDNDLSSNVLVKNNVNVHKEGKYRVEYSVSDSSGNKTIVYRNVTVQKADITLDDTSGNKITMNSYNVTRYSNTIINNSWVFNGIYYEGYVKDKSDTYKLKLKNSDNGLEYVFYMALGKNNYYNGILDLTKVPNGDYLVYLVGNKEERLQNKLGILSRLVRSKVGNKLVTITYDNDYVNISIKDFKYEYDIVIDPGHGGSEDGASNGIVKEKNINLKQSLYEKCRYESMGYRVYMTRYNDSEGYLLGSNDLHILQRRALVIGYYGAVSRVAYSNHHNASLNSGMHGFEILVSNSLSEKDLSLEKTLYNKYKEFYNIKDNSVRLYSRDYDSGIIYNKLNGDVYQYNDYYAVIRTPLELFNVKNVIYEPIYMSNASDFNWYWNNKKWIDVTEMKIFEYVQYLGGTYNKDNSMCL